VRSFIGQYLPILEFPQDVRAALERGEVNLFEAHQLARLTPKRLGSTEGEASTQRRKLLEAHLMALESGARLRARVKEMLGEVEVTSPTKTEALAVEKADELLEVDPADSTHLFYEELRRIGRAIREVEAEGLTEDDFNSLMPLLDELSTVLHRIEVRQRPKSQELKKVSV
jgi:phosphoenolpyruvate carboxylase